MNKIYLSTIRGVLALSLVAQPWQTVGEVLAASPSEGSESTVSANEGEMSNTANPSSPETLAAGTTVVLTAHIP